MNARLFDLRSIARALGGEIVTGQVLAPGPGHGPRDRSLSVRLSAASPDGFIVHSFAGDGWQECRAHVCAFLGIVKEGRSRKNPTRRRPTIASAASGDADCSKAALTLWREGVDPRGTLAERYLNSRKLELGDDLPGETLRWHPRIGALLALFRNIETNRPQAINRTFLDPEARKLKRKFLAACRT
jgi:putative DNA primase/helicase